VSSMEIGRWLHADALVYGEVVDYEAYWVSFRRLARDGARQNGLNA
jgi:hypothetical protein